MSKDYKLREGEDLITKFEFLSYSPGHLAVKDISSVRKRATNDLALLHGWDHGEGIIGKTDDKMVDFWRIEVSRNCTNQ